MLKEDFCALTEQILRNDNACALAKTVITISLLLRGQALKLAVEK